MPGCGTWPTATRGERDEVRRAFAARVQELVRDATQEMSVEAKAAAFDRLAAIMVDETVIEMDERVAGTYAHEGEALHRAWKTLFVLTIGPGAFRTMNTLDAIFPARDA